MSLSRAMHITLLIFFLCSYWVVGKIGKPKEKINPVDASLLTAAFKGRVEMANDALRRGANIECRDGKEGNTPLIFAARHGHVELINVLLSAGANIEALSHDGEKTPLLMAAYAGNVKVVETLLHRGASADSTNQRGDTPLLLGTYSGSVGVVQLLLSRGADMNRRSIKHLYSPLYIAASSGFSHIVAELLQQVDEVEVDIQDKTGRTPLHAAVAENYPGIARQLVLAGASVEQRDSRGTNPLFAAVKANCAECVSVLVNQGLAKLNTREGSSRFTPLMRAASLGYEDVMRVLLDAGADVDVAVPMNKTASAAAAAKKPGVPGAAAAADEDEDEGNMEVEVTFVDDRNKPREDDDEGDGSYIDLKDLPGALIGAAGAGTGAGTGTGTGTVAGVSTSTGAGTSREGKKLAKTNSRFSSSDSQSTHQSSNRPKKPIIQRDGQSSGSGSDELPTMVTALSLVRKSGCRRCVELMEERVTCSAAPPDEPEPSR